MKLQRAAEGIRVVMMSDENCYSTRNTLLRKLSSRLASLHFKAVKKNRARLIISALLLGTVATLNGISAAQTSLPFEVSNPKHQKWSTEEAERIYSSACELVARSIRPERPPHLHPNFVLVLGAKDDATVRNGAISEIHLKAWNPAHFAEAVVIMATREILKTEDLTVLTRDTLVAAQATISVNELRHNH